MANLIIKTCPICRNQFTTNRAAAVFCKWACYQEHHKSEPVIKTCQTCGSEFEPKRESSNAKRKINYCSWACRGAAATKRANESDYSKRFWSKVDKTGECWEWKASLRSKKIHRGVFILHGKRRPAYQVAYMLTHNVSDFGGLFVCHRCNNPKCVRPEHLYLGTHYDNMQDRKAAGRYVRKPKKLP